MPTIGFPASPTNGQLYPTVNPRWQYTSGSPGRWDSIAYSTPGTNVDDRLTTILGTDDMLVLRTIAGVVTPFLASGSALQTFFGGTPSATAPAAFSSGQWTLSAITGGLRINITALPSDGGSAITEIQYRLNSGTWTALVGTGTGIRDITGLPSTLHTVEIRAVNAINAADPSDTKSETPNSSGSTLAIVQAPTPIEQPYGTMAEQTLSAVGSGNSLVVTVHVPSGAATPTISDSAGNTWAAPLRSYPDGTGVTTYYWKLDGVTGNPTWVRATLSGAEGFHLAAVEVSGAGAGLVEDDFGSGLQTSSDTWNMGFTTTVANALFVAMLKVENSNTSTPVSPLTRGTATGGYQIFAQGIFPSVGSNTATIGFNTSFGGSRSWLVLKGS